MPTARQVGNPDYVGLPPCSRRFGFMCLPHILAEVAVVNCLGGGVCAGGLVTLATVACFRPLPPLGSPHPPHGGNEGKRGQPTLILLDPRQCGAICMKVWGCVGCQAAPTFQIPGIVGA